MIPPTPTGPNWSFILQRFRQNQARQIRFVPMIASNQTAPPHPPAGAKVQEKDMSEPIKRYSPGDITVGEKCVLVPYVSGEIVMYADHQREVDDLKMEIKLLWTALTNEVSVDRIQALSTAVLAARKVIP
jgi:hypothetical protein